MRRLTAVLITFNEEAKIENALRSVLGVADEIVVVDSFSSDRTPAICRRYTEKVVQKSWAGYRDQKQFAAELAGEPWVLSLDADEALSAELREEILQWKQSRGHVHAGYYLPRKTYFLGRWIEHTTWYPDWQLRLFDRSRGCWQGGRVHESVGVTGSTGRMRGHLLHYTYASVSEYLAQLERFSSLAAADYFDAGQRAGVLRLAFSPPLIFLKNYLLRLGFLDGVPGLAVSVLSATSTFFKYLKLWEMQLQSKAGRPSA